MSEDGNLLSFLAEEVRRPVSEGVGALVDAIRCRHGRSVQAVLFYGSCLRRRDLEGMADLYVLVDRYGGFYSSRPAALLNALLPPNVYHLEIDWQGRTLRAKYAVVALGDFERLNSVRSFDAYFWARFAQPCALIFAADAAAADSTLRALRSAILTFVRRGVTLVAWRFSAAELWTRQLRESYRSEIRFEKALIPEELYQADPRRYELVTRLALAELGIGGPVENEVAPGTFQLRARLSAWERRAGSALWAARRCQGKLFSLLRLAKGAFTFRGGIQYAAWKIERHTGVKIETAQTRLWTVARELVRVYRQRSFR